MRNKAVKAIRREVRKFTTDSSVEVKQSVRKVIVAGGVVSTSGPEVIEYVTNVRTLGANNMKRSVKKLKNIYKSLSGMARGAFVPQLVQDAKNKLAIQTKIDPQNI